MDKLYFNPLKPDITKISNYCGDAKGTVPIASQYYFERKIWSTGLDSSVIPGYFALSSSLFIMVMGLNSLKK